MGVSNPSSLYPGSSGGPTVGRPGKDGKDGAPGKSAYELAVDHGYVGSEADWLDSLIGPPGVDGDGRPGDSAYEIAKQAGFKGTREEWLQSLHGAPGKSAYEIAVDNGFEGTIEEWLESLVGEPGSSYTPPEGDVPLKTITQEEYDALTDEEKQSETAWLITDSDTIVTPPETPTPSIPDTKTYNFGHGFTTTTIDGVVNVTVNTVSNFDGDNTLPIQAAAVQTIVGNIDALLATI